MTFDNWVIDRSKVNKAHVIVDTQIFTDKKYVEFSLFRHEFQNLLFFFIFITNCGGFFSKKTIASLAATSRAILSVAPSPVEISHN